MMERGCFYQGCAGKKQKRQRKEGKEPKYVAFPRRLWVKRQRKEGNPAKSVAFRAGKKQERQRKKGKEPKYVAFPRPEQAETSNNPKIKRSCALRMQQLLF